MIKVSYKGKIIVANFWEEIFELMKVVDNMVDYKSICLSGGAVEVV